MLEWYHAEWSYLELMRECEALVNDVVRSAGSFAGIADMSLLRDGRLISLSLPWDRFTVDEVFQKYAGFSALEAVERGVFDELLVTLVEPRLGWERPAFLYDYPVALGSLARRKKSDPSLAERFELYIAGIELVNGFSELVDPDEQRKRFVQDIMQIQHMGRSSGMPEKFLASLGQMGETAGAAMGFDRLFMLLLGAGSMAEVVCLDREDLE